MIARILKFVFFAFIVFFVSLFIFVNTGLFDRFLQKKIEERVLNSTGLTLKFSRFYVSFFKGKLQADGVKLGGVLEVKKIDIDISSLKLLLAKLDIERARVYGVTVNIDRDFDIKSFSENPKELDKKGFGSIIVRDFRLEDVNVKFSDREGNIASFVSRDFLIQAGFDLKRGTYSGVVAFNNGKVVYNQKPYLLNVACYFDFNEDSLTIKELTVTMGGLNLKSKGRFANLKQSISIEGSADLFRLSGIEELKGIKVNFNIKGNLHVLKGKVLITDGKRSAKGDIFLDMAKRVVTISNLNGNFKQHNIKLFASLSFKKKLKFRLNSSIKGRYLKNFHLDVNIEKKRHWNYNARIYGVDCGSGFCGVKVISGRIPQLDKVKLNLPFLKTDIEKNTGWVEVDIKDVKAFAHGDFFKNNLLFGGLVTVKRFNLFGLTLPTLDARLKVKSRNNIVIDSLFLKEGDGTAKITGSFKDNNLILKAKLMSFPFKKALFFLDKKTLDNIEIYGAASGLVDIKGHYENPSVRGDVTLEHTNVYGLFFNSVNTNFVYLQDRLTLSKTAIESGDGFLKGGGYIDFKSGAIDLDFKGEGVELNYIPLEDLYAEGCFGRVRVFNNLNNLMIDSSFKIGDVMFSDLSFGGGSLNMKMAQNDISIKFKLKNGLSGSGIIKGGQDLSFNFTAKNFVYSDDKNTVQFSGFFNLKGSVDSTDSFTGYGLIDSMLFKNNLFHLKGEKIEFNMSKMKLLADRLFLFQKDPSLEVTLQNIVLNLDNDEVNADLTLNCDASLINKVLAENSIEGVNVQGKLGGDFKIYGVIYSPFYSGELSYGGNVNLVDAGYLVKDANLTADIDYDIVNVRSFKGKIKDGYVDVSGTIVNGMVDFRGKVNNVPVDMPGFYADSYGVIFLKSEENGERYSVSGYLRLKNGILNVSQMLSGEQEEGFLNLVDLNLKTSLEGVSYSDKDITLLFGKSRLEMIGTAASPVLHGVQYISKDSYLNIGDTRFYVEKGKLIFNNPIENNPYVNIVASAYLNNYRVRCYLKGNSDKVNIKFSSDPPLSQNKILGILFGGGINTGLFDFYHYSSEENLSGVGAALALNTILSSFNNKMKKTLKVDRFSISSQVFDVTRSPSPVISFEKGLSSRLSFLYAQSLDAGDTLMEMSYHMAGRKNVYIRKEIDGSITVEFEILK